MFRIGDFSKFSCVSVKALRHYDELGLLRPAHVDPFTNYRYYLANQLPRLHRILALKALGFQLDQIAPLLADELSIEELRGMLKLKRAEIQLRLQQEQTRLLLIENHLAQLLADQSPAAYDVVIRTVDRQLVAGLRTALARQGGDVASLFDEAETFAANQRIRAPLPPLLIYHDTEYQAWQQDIEVIVPISAPVAGNERIAVYELPGVATMACLVHTGHYATLSQALGTLLRWIEANHYTMIGPTRECFLRFGADQVGYELPDTYLTDQATEFVTELQVPVAKI